MSVIKIECRDGEVVTTHHDTEEVEVRDLSRESAPADFVSLDFVGVNDRLVVFLEPRLAQDLFELLASIMPQSKGREAAA